MDWNLKRWFKQTRQEVKAAIKPGPQSTPTITRQALPGMGFVEKRAWTWRPWRLRHYLIRLRTQPEQTLRLIKRRLADLGWHTHKLSIHQLWVGGDVTAVPPVPNHQELFVDVGPYRGLEPNAMWAALSRCSAHCGVRHLIHVLSKLPERVGSVTP